MVAEKACEKCKGKHRNVVFSPHTVQAGRSGHWSLHMFADDVHCQCASPPPSPWTWTWTWTGSWRTCGSSSALWCGKDDVPGGTEEVVPGRTTRPDAGPRAVAARSGSSFPSLGRAGRQERRGRNRSRRSERIERMIRRVRVKERGDRILRGTRRVSCAKDTGVNYSPRN